MGQPAVEERALTMGFPEKFEYCVRFQERELPLDSDGTVLSLQQRLLLYALKQQGKNGKNNEPSPSWWDAKEKAKWSAWTELGDMSVFEAMVYFTKTVEELHSDWCLREVEHEEGERKPSTPTPTPDEPQKDEEQKDEAELLTCDISCVTRHTKRVCTRCNEDWGRHVNHTCPDGQRGAWVVGKKIEEEKDQSDRPPSVDGDDTAQLQKQIQTLKYRLNTALKDVQVRDGIITELRCDNQQLRQLLSHHNITAAPSSPPQQPNQSLPPAASTSPLGYYQPKQKPTWMQWFTGEDVSNLKTDMPPTHI